ncbi:MAG: sphinganine kinase lcb4 [Geoglossum umbratile]|nr:MAG: sphinganine kinase lcb4 [Geoglossum umbratile]
MPSEASTIGDPFADPIAEVARAEAITETTLVVGRSATLTLGTDSLIVLDEDFTKEEGGSQESKNTRPIPFHNVLWADISELSLTIWFAQQTSKDFVQPALISYSVEKTNRSTAKIWMSKLLDRAYGESQRQKRIKVLINPFGGKGNAQKLYSRDIEPIFTAARSVIDVERTQYQGHAVEIAENLDVEAYDIVACCSGDGLPHEVFNGLGNRKDAQKALSKVAVVQLPCGTGNAMSWNLNGTGSPSLAALYIVKGIQTPLDLVSITQGNRRYLSFLSQSVGIVAESDLATEHLRWMGEHRFTYGFLLRLLRKTVYPCDLAVKVAIEDKQTIRQHYRQEMENRPSPNKRRTRPTAPDSVDGGLPPLKFGMVGDELPEGWELVPYDTLGNFYVGNMAYMAPNANFFPAALPNDGTIDLVCIDGHISRITALKSLAAVESGTFYDMEHVSYRKVLGFRIIPRDQKTGYISIDGEKVPFEPFQAEIHPGLGTVLSKSGHVYETPGM